MDVIAFGSIMYMLGLLSCGVLVWFLTRITTNRIPTSQKRMDELNQEFQVHLDRDKLRKAARMAIAECCIT